MASIRAVVVPFHTGLTSAPRSRRMRTMFSCPLYEADIKDVFPRVTVYVNVEPCIMCAAALLKLRVKRIYFGCANEKFGGEV